MCWCIGHCLKISIRRIWRSFWGLWTCIEAREGKQLAHLTRRVTPCRCSSPAQETQQRVDSGDWRAAFPSDFHGKRLLAALHFLARHALCDERAPCTLPLEAATPSINECPRGSGLISGVCVCAFVRLCVCAFVRRKADKAGSFRSLLFQ